MELVRAWVAATPTNNNPPQSSACDSVRVERAVIHSTAPPSCNTHCPLCQLILCPPNESRRPKTDALASRPGQQQLPHPKCLIFPTAGAPTRPPNCTVQPTISRPWLEIVSTPSVRVYAQSTPTHSVSYFPPAPGPDRTVTSKFQICVDVHLNDGLEPNCG